MINIIKFLYRCLLTLNATILLAFIYIVKCKVYIEKIGVYSIVIYLFIIMVFTFVCLLGIVIFPIFPCDSLENIQAISLANDTYMPSYLGYFFVALSIPDKEWLVFGIVFAVIFVFTYFSQSLYFNPLFLLLGYNFYYVSSQNRARIFVISKKKDICSAKEINFNLLSRINNFTFIDKEP